MQLVNDDCLEVMRNMPSESVDAIVTDPPYGLNFMGKHWDYDVPSVEIWRECLRVLKPGGHLLSFAGTRTQHRMAVNIEDAGFEIRDMIAWVYGSGFPKSHNLKDEWQGWGTALKPALEPITVARKPLIGTVAENVLTHGTGALNIEGCRVGADGGTAKGSRPTGKSKGIYGAGLHGACEIKKLEAGRWPANLIHDGGEYFGEQSRFFYCAKASKKDRDEGLEGFKKTNAGVLNMRTDSHSHRNGMNTQPRVNNHPTVKPTDLMRYLCRLVTPPDGTILDPFMGSGSTGKAATLEGFDFIGIERDKNYYEIAITRIKVAQ